MRVRRHIFNGGFTDVATATTRRRRMSYYVAEADNGSENSNTNNAWRVGRTSVNNNNKNNTNPSRPVAALGMWEPFYWSMVEAYRDCIRNKRTRPQAMEYMPIAAQDIPKLAAEVWDGIYKPSTSTCFMVTFPKLREVFAAAFRDRVIHHWICLRLVPVFEYYAWMLGNCSHACRKGFGNRTAIAQVEGAMCCISEHYRKPCWVYRGDIVSFFMSIDKLKMLDIINRIIDANRKQWPEIEYKILKRLVEITIMHQPHKDCVINSPLELWQQIDPSKSMFYTPDAKSMPIGNLTTQLFAGAYMFPAIKYIRGRFRHYFGKQWQHRISFTISVDDFIFVCSDKAILKRIAREFEAYLRDPLLLACHSEKVYFQPVSHGVKFLGKWIKPHRRYIINRTAGRFRHAITVADSICSGRASPMDLERIRASLNSYLGILKGTRSRKIIDAAFVGVGAEFHRYFEIKNNKISIKKDCNQ